MARLASMAALSLAGLCCFEFSLPGISAHALKVKMLRAQGFFLPGRKCRGAQCNRMGWGCRGGRERKKAVLQTKVATSLDIKGQEGAQGLQSHSEGDTEAGATRKGTGQRPEPFCWALGHPRIIPSPRTVDSWVPALPGH